MNAGEGTTVIGKSVRIVGDLSGSEDLQLDGELQGTIQLPGSRLTLGASARVHGDAIAQEVIVLGRVEGDIRAKGRVELRASSVVQGNIYAGTLSMEENAVFHGQVDPSRAGESLPERPAAGTGTASGSPSRTTPFPAALAAVAAGRSPLMESASGGEGSRSPAPLFAKTEV